MHARGGHGGRGLGGRSFVHCQVCHKFGHDEFIFFHRYKKYYMPPNVSTSNSQPNSYNSSWNSANTDNPLCLGKQTFTLYPDLQCLTMFWSYVLWYTPTSCVLYASLS